MSRNFEPGQQVKVTKAPAEAPHLLGKTGKVVYAWRNKARVYLNDAYTDLSIEDVEHVSKK